MVEGKLSGVWPGRLGAGMGLGKRNFLMKERKLFLPFDYFQSSGSSCVDVSKLCALQLLSCPAASPGAGTQELCVSAHLALKSDSKINFLLL